ncbi:MAG: flagellar hook-basal body complex protein FliE [Huintestinicola sp.]
MFIVPISSAITPLNTMSQLNTEEYGTNKQSPSFSDVFREIYQDVQDTQQTVNEDAAKLVLGEIDDLHTIYNNMTKAEVAVETFVAVKNAAQKSYDNIMQMTM